MSNRFSIAVIIPTYNRRESLCRALDSVIGQTRPPDEIVVVDDGSDDGTQEAIANLYPHITYLFHENHGVSYSRNRGVESAKSNWIAFLDNDDTWLPKKLETQIVAIEKNPEFQLCHTEEIWIRNGVRVNQMNKHKKNGGDIYLDCLKLCAISPSSVMMTRKLFEDAGGFDESLPACEDYDLWLRVCAHQEVLFVETPLVMKYGGHEDQLSRKYWGMDRFRIQALQKILESESENFNYYEATLEMLKAKCQILIQGALKRGNEKTVEYYRELLSRYCPLESKFKGES